jgi:hypothetical protein
MIDTTTQPIYHQLLFLRDFDASPQEYKAAIAEVLRMMASDELQFTARYSAIMRLLGKGFKEGVRVRDGSGVEGIVPSPHNWGCGAYSYHVSFTNEQGKSVLLTNGIFDATIL